MLMSSALVPRPGQALNASLMVSWIATPGVGFPLERAPWFKNLSLIKVAFMASMLANLRGATFSLNSFMSLFLSMSLTFSWALMSASSIFLLYSSSIFLLSSAFSISTLDLNSSGVMSIGLGFEAAVASVLDEL